MLLLRLQLNWISQCLMSLLHSPPSSPSINVSSPSSLSRPCGLCPSIEDSLPPAPSDADPAHMSPPPSSPIMSAPTVGTHHMVTRSKADIFKPRYFADIALLAHSSLISALLTTTTHKGFKSAAKHLGWLAAMNDEIKALHSNNMWELVPRPFGTNVVDDRLKARLVAQDFTQLPRFNYDHTFSPVIKAATLRVVLSLLVLRNWPLHHLDVKHAFLHGQLSKPVFMEQPPGFIDPHFLNHVCRLRKALYGLKQAPLAWFQRFSSFLLGLGFVGSKVDTSHFVYHRGHITLHILVYIDDIILTGSDPSLIRRFIGQLHSEFRIRILVN